MKLSFIVLHVYKFFYKKMNSTIEIKDVPINIKYYLTNFSSRYLLHNKKSSMI